MKKLLFILLVTISVAGYSQVTPSSIIRVANSTTAFNETVPAGKDIVDNASGKQYVVLLPLANTKTIATCTASELRDLSLWQLKRRIFGRYVDGSVSMDSTITDAYIASAANWNTAFGWGNHAGLYRPIAWVPAWSDVTSKPTTLSTIATNDLGNYGGFKLGSDSTNTTSGYTTLYQNSLKAAASHTHPYLPLAGGTLTGALYGTSASFSSTITASDHILSDIRLKKNIQRLSRIDFLKVKDIRFIKYTMKADSTNNIRYGVSAQQVENILPEVVYTDEKGTKSVAYIDMLVLIAAQQKNEIDSLKIKVQYLERIVNRLIELR